MIRFNANLYRLAFSCASNEETHYYLKGVYVEPHAQGGVTLTATDGHRLICIRDESGQADESAIINLGDAPKQCKPKRNERRDVVIATGSKDAIVNTTIEVPDRDEKTNAPTGTTTLEDTPIATAFGVKVDGSYPSYRQVVPQSFTREGAPGFQGRYIAAFGDLACDLAAHAGRTPGKYDQGESRSDVLRIFCGDGKYPEGAPALVIFPAFDFVFGILMPYRVKNDVQGDAPAWFRYPTASIAQADEHDATLVPSCPVPA